MWSLLLATAFASPPDAHVAPDGGVTGSFSTPTSAAAVIEKLADPSWVAEVDGSGTQVSIAGADGDCLLVDYVSPNAVRTATYRLRRCRLEDGIASTLVESETVRSWSERWTVVTVDGETRVTYALTVQPDFPLPGFVVDRTMLRSIRHMLAAIETALQ